MRKTESDSKGPGEFIFFALEFLPDEIWPVSIVIGVVFGLIWLIREIFRMSFSPSMDRSYRVPSLRSG
jgi:hypothetical protein